MFRSCSNKALEGLGAGSDLGVPTSFPTEVLLLALDAEGAMVLAPVKNFPSWFCLARLRPALSFKSLFKLLREQTRSRHIRFKYLMTNQLPKHKVFTRLQ